MLVYCLCRRISTVLHGLGCDLGMVDGALHSSCALLGKFAIGAQVLLL